jgi:large subunit ribosomal protein L10
MVNKLQVEVYKKRFKDASFLISVGYPKLNVKGMDDLRGRLAAQGGNILFIRNRLAVIAVKELGLGDAKAICHEQTAFVWGEDPVSTARFLVDFKKEHAELLIHGALLDQESLGGEAVIALSKSPTREELKSIISGQALAMGGRLSAQFIAAGGLLASQVEKLASEEGGDAA